MTTPRKPFGDLTAAEQGDWMTSDPDTYWPAAWAWARESVERDARRQVARQRRQDLDRLLRPFRAVRTAARRLLRGDR